MSNTHIAELMWDAYATQAGGKTFDGKPLPTWEELGDERQSCWAAAASVISGHIEKLEAANLKQSCIIIDTQTRIEKLEAALLVALGMLSEMGLSAAEKCELAYEYLLKHRSEALEGKDD